MANLSDDERECLKWITHGMTPPCIGLMLNLGEATVKTHLENALRKLDADTPTLAVCKAIHTGLIQWRGISAVPERKMPR